MDKELLTIQIKMKALGLAETQIQSILRESLGGRIWSELGQAEKKEILDSLEKRIAFARNFLRFLACEDCYKKA